MEVKIGNYEFPAVTLSNLSSVYDNSRKLKITNSGTDYYVPLAWNRTMVKDGGDYINTNVIFKNNNNYYYPIKMKPKITLRYICEFINTEYTLIYNNGVNNYHSYTENFRIASCSFSAAGTGNKYLFIVRSDDKVISEANYWPDEGSHSSVGAVPLAFIITDDGVGGSLNVRDETGNWASKNMTIEVYKINNWLQTHFTLHLDGSSGRSLTSGYFPSAPFASVDSGTGGYWVIFYWAMGYYGSMVFTYIKHHIDNANMNLSVNYFKAQTIKKGSDLLTLSASNVGYSTDYEFITKKNFPWTKEKTEKYEARSYTSEGYKYVGQTLNVNTQAKFYSYSLGEITLDLSK